MKLSLLPVLAAVVVCAGTARAQQGEPLGISAPPKGHLTAEQLQAVARDIRAVEAHPFAPDVLEARRALLVWLIDSPDITVHVCAGPAEALAGAPAELIYQWQVSSAAYMIEHPDSANDAARVSVGGLRGALATWAAMKAALGDGPRDAALDRLAASPEEVERAGAKGCASH